MFDVSEISERWERREGLPEPAPGTASWLGNEDGWDRRLCKELKPEKPKLMLIITLILERMDIC